MRVAIVNEIHTDKTANGEHLSDTQKLYTVLVTEENLTGLSTRWYKTLHDNGFAVINRKHLKQVKEWLRYTTVGHFCLGSHIIIPLAYDKHKDDVMSLLVREGDVSFVRYNGLTT